MRINQDLDGTCLTFNTGDVNSPFMAISLAAAGSMSLKAADGWANRKRLFAGLKLQGSVHALYQQHSRRILTAGPRSAVFPPLAAGDGLCLRSSTEYISVTAADCMPIWLWSEESTSLALLHSGWQGTGILSVAIEKLRRYASTGSMKVLLGPSIGSCCYRVEEERYRLFKNRFGAAAVRRDDGDCYLSLLGANRTIAAEYGIDRLYEYTPCTVCNPEFGSFRRQGAQNFTSMLALGAYFQ